MADVLSCPSCDDQRLVEAGRTMRCEVCDGAWIAEDVLVAILEQRASALVSLPWKTREDTIKMPCPSCKTTMQTVSLGDVQLDRCAEHGVWFDAHELAALLKQSRRFRTDHDGTTQPSEEHKGLLASLRSLFKR